MKRYLKLYWLLGLNSLRIALEHRTGVIFFIFGKIVRFLMFFAFIFILLKNTRVLAGYTLNQTLVFYLTFNVIDTFTQMLFREVYRFRWLVVSGELDGILVKPHHPFLRVLFGGLDVMDAVILIFYLLLLGYYLLATGVMISFNWLIYLLLFVNAVVISAAFHILVLAMGIITTEVDHTIMIYRDFSKMAMVPVDIYKEPLRSLITFVVPIGIMMTYPVKGLFNLLNYKTVVISLFFGALSLFLSLYAWKQALRKYQSWGS